MKIIYIAHPMSGDIEGNREKLISVIRHINLNEPDVVPYAGYLVDFEALDDFIPEERERGIRNDTHILETCIDEVRVYGTPEAVEKSKGVQAEVDLANKLGLRVSFCSYPL